MRFSPPLPNNRSKSCQGFVELRRAAFGSANIFDMPMAKNFELSAGGILLGKKRIYEIS